MLTSSTQFLGLLLFCLACLLALLWLLMPIILYQIRIRLDTLITETRETRWAISKLTTLIEKQHSNPPKDL